MRATKRTLAALIGFACLAGGVALAVAPGGEAPVQTLTAQ